MRIFAFLAVIACAVAPIFSHPVGIGQHKYVATQPLPELFYPYTIKISYGSHIKHVLGVFDEEKQQNIIDSLVARDAKVNGDWYICPTSALVHHAKYITTLNKGVVYNLHARATFFHFSERAVRPFVEMTKSANHKRLYAFKQQSERDAFREITRHHNFTTDVDWDVAPNYLADIGAVTIAKAIGVASIFQLT